MARKKTSQKSKPDLETPEEEVTSDSTEEQPVESPDTDAEEIDAFDLDTVPTADKAEEMSEVEKEIKQEEEEFEEEIQEERYYTIPLAKGWVTAPRWNRANKAMKVLRVFLKRHMKPEGDVYVSQDLNERIWENGLPNPPRRVRVRVTKSVDGVVRAYLA